MIERRPFGSLGGADHGWLKRHHFSFARYHDPERMGWGALRVWNDDEIAPKSGFPPHPHADMEIITYVREGAITHEDDLGNKGRTEAGDVQVMNAGRGIRHAEYNREPKTTKIFQIWIEPARHGGKPVWAAKPFPTGDRGGRFVTLASGSMMTTMRFRSAATRACLALASRRMRAWNTRLPRAATLISCPPRVWSR
jgi:quercetin 2,3-dioxygenase